MPLNRRKVKPNNKGFTCLIDGDVIVYAAGFASDQRTYLLPDGESFKYKKEAVIYADEIQAKAEDIEVIITPEPIEHCLHTVKLMIKDIMETTGSEQVKVFLSGKGNFRKEIDPLYKIGRKNTPKPTHFTAIRDYLEDTWDAEVTEGQEADDAMGIYQSNNDKTIICTVDKDLDMIEGLHYNWNKKDNGVYSISPFEGLQKFYQQILKGDNVDDIIAIKGIGEVKARKMLEECKTEEEMCIETQLAYAEYGLTPEKWLINARLLWIRREENELWTPQKTMRTEWLNSYMMQK